MLCEFLPHVSRLLAGLNSGDKHVYVCVCVKVSHTL